VKSTTLTIQEALDSNSFVRVVRVAEVKSTTLTIQEALVRDVEWGQDEWRTIERPIRTWDRIASHEQALRNQSALR
jgi:hypothetical protein